jgi:hypothetical protein
MDGKPQRMFKHLISSCTKVGVAERASITLLKKSASCAVPSLQPLLNENDSKKPSDSSLLSFYQPAKFSKEAENEINLEHL